MDLIKILKEATEKRCSDIFIVPGAKIAIRKNDCILPFSGEKIMPDVSMQLIKQLYQTDNNRSMDQLILKGDDDFSLSLPSVGRFRCNVYMQRNSYAAVLRVVYFELPNASDYHIPQEVIDLYREKNGLILVTGPTSCGKSTTLACIVDQINSNFSKHVITIEDPIEFLHRHKKSIVSQREVTLDTTNYITALRAALRQSPDAILVGEMRDLETIQIVLTAAETGQLVLSSLHTIGAAKTIDRIIDVFPANQQMQVRLQLSMVLKAVVSQQLIPIIDGRLEPVFEIMYVNNAVQNLIRESKIYQIDNVIYSGASQGMRAMDTDILRLYNEGIITKENALIYAMNPDSISKKL